MILGMTNSWTGTGLNRWLEAVAGLFYGEVCQSCQNERATRAEGYVCQPCRQKMRFIAPPFCDRCGAIYEGDITTEFVCGNCQDMELHFSHARAVVGADETFLNVLRAYKYGRALWVEPYLADLLGQAAAALRNGGWDMIVPVPLHVRRQREREFNQAERLGRHLSRASEIRLETGVLERVIDTPTQTHRSRRERAENVSKAFAVRRAGEKVLKRRIVLFDDVLTTGATANACARVLRDNGAAEVCAWTVARGLLH